MKAPRYAKKNFEKILPYLAAADGNSGHVRLESGGYMPLVIENLEYTDADGNPVYSMTHYGELNGDAMADPDMTFAVDFKNGTVIPRTFQNDYMGAYDEVFIEDENGKPTKYRPGLLRSLDDFLRTWLQNIEHQGFDPVPKAETAE